MNELQSKLDFRREARGRRAAMSNRESASARILDQVFATVEYQAAQRVLFYVGIGHEVATLPHLQTALAAAKTVFVPLCLDNELQLFELRSFDELVARTLGIPEPREELWSIRERFADVRTIDLAVIPGLAFGRDGTRIGQGRGYYDRLLARGEPGRPVRLAVAFECQVFDHVASTPRDALMDAIITESQVYTRTPASIHFTK